MTIFIQHVCAVPTREGIHSYAARGGDYFKKKTCALPVVHRGQTKSTVIVEVPKLREKPNAIGTCRFFFFCFTFYFALVERGRTNDEFPKTRRVSFGIRVSGLVRREYNHSNR